MESLREVQQPKPSGPPAPLDFPRDSIHRSTTFAFPNNVSLFLHAGLVYKDLMLSILKIHAQYIVSVLWQEDGYMWSIAWARRKSPGQSPTWVTIKTFSITIQYCPSWESNIGRVDSHYFSGSWGYIFQYTPSSTGSVLENIPPALLGVYLADLGEARGCSINSLVIN